MKWPAGRPFAWIDDEITDADRDWVRVHHPGRALLRHVPSYRGLTDADFTTLLRWLEAICGEDTSCRMACEFSDRREVPCANRLELACATEHLGQVRV